MFRRLIPLAILVGLVSLAAIACGGDPEPTATPQPTSPPPPPPVPTAAATVVAPTAAPVSAPTTAPAPTGGGEGHTVTVINQDLGGSGEYKFVPSEFTFSVGETVNFVLTSETEFHTFTVDDLGIDEQILPGETGTLSFTFDSPGEYTVICIPHEVLGMVGTITVQ